MAIPRFCRDRPPQRSDHVERLKAYGIPTRQARNAALIALAGELPISLVSDLFGISISTAMHWARRAGKDWNAYLAASHQGRSATSPPWG